MTTTSELKAGDRYVVTEPFQIIVLVQFFAPFTDGEYKTLPAGLEFALLDNPYPTAEGVGARPVDFDGWSRELVSAENLGDELYGGYSLSIRKSDLAAHCAKVG